MTRWNPGCSSRGMRPQERAPALERWTDHLNDLGNRELAELAGDYCWLMEKNRPQEERAEFGKRREAILRECERRGMEDAAKQCRPSSGLQTE